MSDISENKDTSPIYKMVRMPVGTHEMLQKYAKEMSELHGFNISLPKAVQILLYRHFTPDNHYDNPKKKRTQ